MAFQLDTSGYVALRRHDLTTSDPNAGDPVTHWHDLSPFAQGYIEALFASLFQPRQPYGVADYLEGDRDFVMSNLDLAVWMLTHKRAPSFSDLAPETLARLLDDCTHLLAACWIAEQEGSEEDGRICWRARRGPAPYLAEDGLVYLREAV